MLTYILFRYFHFFAIFGVITTVAIQNIAIKPSITREDAVNLTTVNVAFNISVLLAFIAGFTLWFLVGKPSDFYTKNLLFVTKLIIFTFVLLSGLIITKFFRSHKNPINKSIKVPQLIIFVLRLQLVFFTALLILAFFITRGIGLEY